MCFFFLACVDSKFPQPKKPVEDPKNYRPISPLSVLYKIPERPIYTRVKPIIDLLFPEEKTGFRHGRSTVDQAVLLMQNIEDSFEAMKKSGTVFLDLTMTLRHCLAPQLHLQAAETSPRKAHGPNDLGTYPK